jgi:adenylate cyclase
MSDVFVSYARENKVQSEKVAEALRALGRQVWRDDQIPANRSFGEVLEERLAAAKVVLVLWSAEATRSDWVRSEASRARVMGKLVQATLDKSPLPMPFDQIQCASLVGWNGEAETPGWRNVVASIDDLAGSVVAQPQLAAVAPAQPPSKPSIAVLPFASLSGDPDQEYFADGMAEEIVTALSRIRSIFVIASGSTLALKGRNLAPLDIARQLNVRYLLEGSVRKAADRVRVSVKLADTVDSAQVWAERFEDTLEDVFALQDRIALNVAGKIEPTVREAEIQRASARPTDDLNSYDLYLRALPLWRGGKKPGVLAALELLHRAIAIAPGYGAALAVAAGCHGWLAATELSDQSSNHAAQAVDLAHRALQAAPDDPEVLTYAADALHGAGGDRKISLALLDQAIALNPGYAFAWLLSGAYRVQEGLSELGAEHLQMSMRLDPMTTFRGIQLCWMGIAHFEQERFDEAIGLLGQATALLPNYPSSYAVLASCCGYLGRMDQGRGAIERFHGLQSLRIEEWAAIYLAKPEHRTLHAKGVALIDQDEQAL